MDNHEKVNRKDSDDKTNHIAVQHATSGRNKASTNVENTFMPISIPEFHGTKMIASYISMLSILFENKYFLAKHEELILQKIEACESLILNQVEEEKEYKQKLLTILEKGLEH
ncbi:hypothetical protein DS745_20560 [Anaerobacillus alkaliphilus]|uniref:Uncharacterized protein n=1 Tax=Anaerobacillus alkaliphilus TaxID=1548597 RepID=A0A4Q0VMU0_9BACI|nr:hypothetical protein [Anaerobacillus alkaliphilus]RXI96140.1 hypothetical protein DS745_20560 [Anaerobacillus alkaliphilus]